MITFEHDGRSISYELKPPSRLSRRKMAMMLMDGSDEDWGLELFVESIDGQHPLDADALTQWLVWTHADDFLSRLPEAIGMVAPNQQS